MAARPIVAGVAISHPDRLLFSAAGASKLDLALYYEAIADWMLPHVVDRPLTLVRCPTGVRAKAKSGEASTDCFYMKHAKVWAPPALRRVRIREKTKLGEYLIADSVAALVSLAQMDVLSIHTWNSRFARLEQPDCVVIDLDPGPRVDWPAVVEAAVFVRRLLVRLDLESFVKTTGGRGLHVVVPLTPSADWTECLAFARGFAEATVRLAGGAPVSFTTDFSKRGRERKILVDYLRNNRTNTSIAAFSTRARSEATVSIPLAWKELSPSRPPQVFTIASAPDRLAHLRTDPWKDYWAARQRLPRGGGGALQRL